jgi:mannose-6-phosphate isomerase-like protein (cupin superfamily)
VPPLDRPASLHQTPRVRAVASRRLAQQEETMSQDKWKFSHNVAAEAKWTPGLREIFDYRDLGFKDSTNGDYVAHIVKANGKKSKDEVQKWHVHDCNFQMVYVLNGWAKFEYAGQGVKTIKKGDCINQRPGIPHREIACSEDFEVLEVVSPANFATRIVEGPDGKLEAAE